jgi:hypothetical protein
MGETPKPRSEPPDVARASRPWDLSLNAFSCWCYTLIHPQTSAIDCVDSKKDLPAIFNSSP